MINQLSSATITVDDHVIHVEANFQPVNPRVISGIRVASFANTAGQLDAANRSLYVGIQNASTIVQNFLNSQLQDFLAWLPGGSGSQAFPLLEGNVARPPSGTTRFRRLTLAVYGTYINATVDAIGTTGANVRKLKTFTNTSGKVDESASSVAAVFTDLPNFLSWGDA